MNRTFTFERSKKKNGQKAKYTFVELENGVQVIRDNDGEIFTHDFTIGSRFVTKTGKKVKMIGWYWSPEENAGCYAKTDQNPVSLQNQIDHIYSKSYGVEDELIRGELDIHAVGYVEGAVKKVLINQYERDPKARRACIDFFGCKCFICNFDFALFYGGYGAGFIEVHHVKPLSHIKATYEVNPIEDLIPVCSNCHSMLHRGKAPLTVEELKSIVN
ncbi:HNH endonuclease [Vibrio harveyi]|uniref:HNH endonuclease n=1 Tax=Vibrio harveyi TaxID=669 RepID=UPI003CF08E4A